MLICFAFVFESNRWYKHNEVKTITFWHYWSGVEKIPVNNLVKKFNSEKHDFKVDVLSISMPQKKILTSIVGNVAPDLVHISGDMATDFALRNALTEIDLEDFDLEKFNPNFLEMLKIDGKQWAMPYIGGTEAMYINRDLMDKWNLKSPETLEDLIKVFDASLKDQNALAFIPSWPSWFGEFIAGYFGGSWVDEEGRVTANSPENIAAWTWIEENFISKIPQEKVLSFTEGFGAYQSPDNPFYSGKVAIEASGVWEKKLAAIYAPEMNIEVKPFPGKVKNATYLSVNALGIPRNAKHKKEAIYFMKWLLKPENVEYLALDQKQFTPYKEHSEEFFQKHENEFIKTFIDLAQSPNAQYMPKVKFLTRYKKEIHNAYDKVNRKQKSATEALNELQSLMEKIATQ